jgi:hypothetical protein
MSRALSHSLHGPQHSRVLPQEQTGGRAKAHEALPYFSCIHRAIVRQRHNTVAIESGACIQGIPKVFAGGGGDEVFGVQ